MKSLKIILASTLMFVICSVLADTILSTNTPISTINNNQNNIDIVAAYDDLPMAKPIVINNRK